MQPEESVTVLRGRDGAPQHAVLEWDHYQGLLAQSSVPSTATHAGERTGHVVPDAIVRRAADGVPPLRAWREFRGFSQAQLALLTGISRAYLTQLETGERAGTLEVMARLARNLGCLIEDLIRSAGDDFAAKLEALARMPVRLRGLVAAIPRAAWLTAPLSHAFCVVEHVCHLRDLDSDGYSLRIERILTEERPQLHGIDGSRLAEERAYRQQDALAALAAFVDVRGRILDRLRRLTAAERQRQGSMEGVGDITIDDVVDAMVAHDSEHLDELTALRDALAAAPPDRVAAGMSEPAALPTPSR